MGASITMDENTTPQVLIEALREQCLRRGCGGIKGLGLVFKNMDIDYSKRIVYEELRIGLQKYGILMSENFLRSLFHTLDRDNSGGIDFQEFMKALRPPMNKGRIDVVNETFDLLDVDHDGLLKTEDLKGNRRMLTLIQDSKILTFLSITFGFPQSPPRFPI